VLRRLARLLLAVALLAGWQAALLHPLQHFDKQGGFVHLADGHSGAKQGEKPQGGSGLCDAIAALAACAPGAVLPFTPLPFESCSLCSSKTERRFAEAPPFLSQAPPALL
jgi:hypothetical protein